MRLYTDQFTMILNYFFKYFIIHIADRIGYESETLKSEKIFRLIFLMLFLNTGWIILLADASLKNQAFFFANAFDGKKENMNMGW